MGSTSRSSWSSWPSTGIWNRINVLINKFVNEYKELSALFKALTGWKWSQRTKRWWRDDAEVVNLVEKAKEMEKESWERSHLGSEHLVQPHIREAVRKLVYSQPVEKSWPERAFLYSLSALCSSFQGGPASCSMNIGMLFSLAWAWDSCDIELTTCWEILII